MSEKAKRTLGLSKPLDLAGLCMLLLHLDWTSVMHCRLQLVSHLLLIYNYFEMLQPDNWRDKKEKYSSVSVSGLSLAHCALQRLQHEGVLFVFKAWFKWFYSVLCMYLCSTSDKESKQSVLLYWNYINNVRIYQQRGFWEHSNRQVPDSCPKSLPVYNNIVHMMHMILIIK